MIIFFLLALYIAKHNNRLFGSRNILEQPKSVIMLY